MNKEQYNNVIDWTLKHEKSAQTSDSLETARAIFNNMGIALPNGNMKEVYETIITNDYMGWGPCTMQEAQEAANKGTASIGISEERIVVLSAADEEVRDIESPSVMILSENTSAYSVSDLQFYSYSYGETDASPEQTAYFNSLVGTRMTSLPNSSFNGQCINYAFLRMREVNELSSPGISYNNPIDWINNANPNYYFIYKTNSYYALDSNYCAVFSNTAVGHIIYIEYVQRDIKGEPLNIYFTEANWDPCNNLWDSTDGILKKMSFWNFVNERRNLEGMGVQIR